jgi:YHS domain-containing protein
MNMFYRSLIFTGGLSLAAVWIAGCDQARPKSTAENSAPELQPASAASAPPTNVVVQQVADEEHEHKPGANGGIIVPIGRDSYHAEAVFEQQGALRIYALGKDEGRVQEIERQTLTAYVKPAGGAETVSFALEPEPQEGDAADKTSRFKGTLPESLRGQPVEVTIPNIRINGERFRLGFPSVLPNHAADAMPASLADEDAKKLFLMPAGKYTQADIAANGNQTGNQKFRGFVPTHDLKPKVGDKICPITLTKANSKCSWIVDGKTYEFCCPPCVEEFVKLAKEQPAEVKDPADYVKR